MDALFGRESKLECHNSAVDLAASKSVPGVWPISPYAGQPDHEENRKEGARLSPTERRTPLHCHLPDWPGSLRHSLRNGRSAAGGTTARIEAARQAREARENDPRGPVAPPRGCVQQFSRNRTGRSLRQSAWWPNRWIAGRNISENRCRLIIPQMGPLILNPRCRRHTRSASRSSRSAMSASLFIRNLRIWRRVAPTPSRLL